MSIIHVNQIKSQVKKLFDNLIDLTDVATASAEMKEDFFLTRGLAAYAIHFLSDATPGEAAEAVTDGGEDNGLDAVHYDAPNKRLYLVQSKWIKDGSGEPPNGDVKKFLGGVQDLFNMQFDRFNTKV